MVKSFHLMVSFFAENKKCDFMVGADLVNADNIGSHKLEDEHNVVSLVNVFLLKLLYRS